MSQTKHGASGEKQFVVVQHVWCQSSANYDSERCTRTLVVRSDTTVEEIMRWSRAASVLKRGDLVLTETDRQDVLVIRP